MEGQSSSVSSVFAISTTLISIFLAILGLVGYIYRPEKLNFIIIGIAIIISFVVLSEKLGRINQNTSAIKELTRSFNTEKRFYEIGKELAEQKGKLSMVVKRR
ncbi:hypothetical protein HYU19_04880 [Candidatus Woesearchaeota archaeon]|nr:hypothetical protein [Candidatus Woesearchaeota archaeon]